jgi:hypothetical protein
MCMCMCICICICICIRVRDVEEAHRTHRYLPTCMYIVGICIGSSSYVYEMWKRHTELTGTRE